MRWSGGLFWTWLVLPVSHEHCTLDPNEMKLGWGGGGRGVERGGGGGGGGEVTHEYHTCHTGRIPTGWNCEGLGVLYTVWSFSFTHHTPSHSHWDNPEEMGGVFWIKVGLSVSHHHTLSHSHWDNPEEMGGVFWIKVGLSVSHHHTPSHSHWDNPEEMGGVFWIKVGLSVSHHHILSHSP